MAMEDPPFMIFPSKAVTTPWQFGIHEFQPVCCGIVWEQMGTYGNIWEQILTSVMDFLNDSVKLYRRLACDFTEHPLTWLKGHMMRNLAQGLCASESGDRSVDPLPCFGTPQHCSCCFWGLVFGGRSPVSLLAALDRGCRAAQRMVPVWLYQPRMEIRNHSARVEGKNRVKVA